MELDSEWLSITRTDPELNFVRCRNGFKKRMQVCSTKSHLKNNSYKNIGLILRKYFYHEILYRYFTYSKYQKSTAAFSVCS